MKHWPVSRMFEDAGRNDLRAGKFLATDRQTLHRILDRAATKDER